MGPVPARRAWRADPASRLRPPPPTHQIAKSKTRSWLSDFISQLQFQIEAFEVEIETARGKGKRGGDVETMREYEEHIARHNMHIANMEKVGPPERRLSPPPPSRRAAWPRSCASWTMTPWTTRLWTR